MTTKRPASRMTKFLAFWTALDVAMAKRGLPAPSFEQATDWFGLELSPDDVADAIATARVAQEASL
jgi:hypothetical protein